MDPERQGYRSTFLSVSIDASSKEGWAMTDRFGRVLAVLAFLVVGCTGSEETEPDARPGSPELANQCEPLDSMPSGTIAFSRHVDDGSAIFVINPDGTNPRCLVDTQGEDTYPAWSPDGATLAFTSDLDGDDDIYIVNADGAGLTKMTDTTTNEYGPEWSPAGTAVAFTTYETEDGPFAVDVLDLDTSQRRMVLESGSRFEYLKLEDWSPNDRGLVVGAYDGKTAGLYLVDPEAGGAELLMSGAPDFASGATFSPDGSTLLFQSDNDGGCLFLMNADGSGVERLTSGCSGATATWSPDGERIAFTPGDHGPADLYVMDADGSNPVLIDDAGEAQFLDWQPS